MERKYLFGSKMLRLDNFRDEDWRSFVMLNASDITEKGCMSLPFEMQVIDGFIHGKNVPGDAYKALYFYQISSDFHADEEEYPLNFNILDYKPFLIDCLKSYMALDRTETISQKREILPKTFYHILYQYNMIIEDTHWISDEARVNVQKIHDLEMPASYFYELRGLINSL